jgi:uncharacterized protein (TIGR02996 family)
MTSTADRVAFLAAIRENPDDDLPRLIFADWLDEHDEPERAEFIRVQVELARTSKGSPQHEELARRSKALHAAHAESWLAELPPLKGVTWRPFHRGFVEAAVTDDFDTFLAASERVFSTTPLHRLSIQSLTARAMRTLAGSPWLAHLTTLDASGGESGNDIVQALVSSPYLARLRQLRLMLQHIGDVGAQVLAESAELAHLHRLDLTCNVIGDTGAEALAAAPGWHDLRRLDLIGNHIGPEGQAVLYARYGNVVKL